MRKRNKNKRTSKQFFNFGVLKNRKGVSVMIGYVLLISAAIVMGAVVYQWLKTYIPKEPLECPDGVALFIKESSCTSDPINPSLKILSLTLKNNGKFNLDGYFIRGAMTGEEQATRDLSEYMITGGTNDDGEIRFDYTTENSFSPNNEFSFEISGIDFNVKSIEIIPVRRQMEDNKKRLVVCGNAKVKEDLPSCSS